MSLSNFVPSFKFMNFSSRLNVWSDLFCSYQINSSFFSFLHIQPDLNTYGVDLDGPLPHELNATK